MKLFYSPGSRAECVRWALDEMSVAYDIVLVDLHKDEHKSDFYRQYHPLGQVPALEDEGIIILERSAILMHLADRFRAKNMAPPPGGPERGIFYQWMVYAVATLEPAAFALVGAADGADKEAARARFDEILAVIDKGLVEPFLFGQSFTVADCLIGHQMIWCDAQGFLSAFPKLQAYAARLAERPAFRQVPGAPGTAQ